MNDLEADLAIERKRTGDLEQKLRVKDNVIDELRADFLNISELCAINAKEEDAGELRRALLAVRKIADANTGRA